MRGQPFAARVESLANIINRGLIAAQPKGAKYTGMHSLRHFYASWCINRTKDGGLGLPPKNVQERLGHASITVTLDRYTATSSRAMTPGNSTQLQTHFWPSCYLDWCRRLGVESTCQCSSLTSGTR